MKSILRILILLLLFSPAVFADSFVDVQIKKLTEEVRASQSLEDIAQKLTQAETVLEWVDSVDDNYKLYLVSEWVDQGQIAPALEVLEKVKPKGSYHDLRSYYNALISIYKGEQNKAASFLVELEQSYPKDPSYLYIKSVFLADRQDLKGAVEALDQAIRQDKRNGRYHLQRGMMRVLVFDYDKALKDFKNATKYLPDSQIYMKQQAYFQMALIYYKVKLDSKKGKPYVEKAVSLAPDSALVFQFKQALRY